MRRVAVADVGGTHARFALATVDGPQTVSVDEPLILKTADYGSFEAAWEAFGKGQRASLPTELAIAFAGPVGGQHLSLTNNPWVIRPAALRNRLRLDRLKVMNDFGAIGHAVASLDNTHFRFICGPADPLPASGVTSIVGPGTGLGVAALLRGASGYEVIETEGGHVDFAPLDPLEDRIIAELRRNFRRVSVERIASGQGLSNLYEALGRIEGRERTLSDQAALWGAALSGTDSLASAALHRLVLSLGAIAGDIALTQGANAVVIAGGLGRRIADHLVPLGFADRFIAKGRFASKMKDIPVRVVTYPEPGLLGAASALARDL
jgi:glucokinase